MANPAIAGRQKYQLANLGANQYQAELEFLIGADAVNVQALDRLVTDQYVCRQTASSLGCPHW